MPMRSTSSILWWLWLLCCCLVVGSSPVMVLAHTFYKLSTLSITIQFGTVWRHNQMFFSVHNTAANIYFNFGHQGSLWGTGKVGFSVYVSGSLWGYQYILRFHGPIGEMMLQYPNVSSLILVAHIILIILLGLKLSYILTVVTHLVYRFSSF